MEIESLYREHGASLLRYLGRTFGSCAPAEDLLQETFVHALGRPAECMAAESPRAFLFGIARHVGLTAVRRAEVRATVPIADVEAKAHAGDEPFEAMRAAIAKLPAAVRETLEFRLRDELSYDEIASIMAIPLGTVRSRLHTAMRLLQDELNPREGRQGEL